MTVDLGTAPSIELEARIAAVAATLGADPAQGVEADLATIEAGLRRLRGQLAEEHAKHDRDTESLEVTLEQSMDHILELEQRLAATRAAAQQATTDAGALSKLVGELEVKNAQLRRDERRNLAHIARTEAEAHRLARLISTPHTDDFLQALRLEAAHQIERWGVEHDAGKRSEDWLALLVHLLGKAVGSHYAGDPDKLKHHIVTTAAACLNWFQALTGDSSLMRPGVADRSPP